MFMKMSGERWVSNVNLTSALFTRKLYVHVCVLVCPSVSKMKDKFFYFCV